MENMPSKEQFQAYEKVRVRGRWNMYDPRAQRATGLTDKEYMAVLSNYEALMVLYPDVRKEGK
jgi:hypothetical protein